MNLEEYEEWRGADEPLEKNSFQWFIATDHAFCTPVAASLLHPDTKPQTVHLVLALNRWRDVPEGIFGDADWRDRLDENLKDTLKAMNRCRGRIAGQKFELCIHDAPLKISDWRRLHFEGVVGEITYEQGIELPHTVVKVMREMDHGKYPDGLTARFTITLSGGFTRSGTWRNPNPFPVPKKDFEERVEEFGKQALGLAKTLVNGSAELVYNVHKELEASDREDKVLEKRQGTFHSSKPYPQLFEDISKVLLEPIRNFHWSVVTDPANSEITAKMAWTEDGNSKREINATFKFSAFEDGTTIEYDYSVFEPLLGSVFTNQLIRITNGWIKSQAEEKPGPPI